MGVPALLVCSPLGPGVLYGSVIYLMVYILFTSQGGLGGNVHVGHMDSYCLKYYRVINNGRKRCLLQSNGHMHSGCGSLSNTSDKE